MANQSEVKKTGRFARHPGTLKTQYFLIFSAIYQKLNGKALDTKIDTSQEACQNCVQKLVTAGSTSRTVAISKSRPTGLKRLIDKVQISMDSDKGKQIH